MGAPPAGEAGGPPPGGEPARPARRAATRFFALAVWCWLVWVLLTWTRTASQLLFGAAVAVLVAVGCSALGPVARPWRLLAPRRVAALGRLALRIPYRVARANVVLAWRIWRPRRPLRSGMVVVPTQCRTEGALTAVGLLTSVIVDNQLVDLHRQAGRLQYHAVWIGSEDPADNYRVINGPVEPGVERLAE